MKTITVILPASLLPYTRSQGLPYGHRTSRACNIQTRLLCVRRKQGQRRS